MRLRAVIAAAGLCLCVGSASALGPAETLLVLNGPPGPSLDCNFLSGGSAPAGSVTVGPNCPPVTFSRASTATDGLYTDATGSAYNSYATGVARLSKSGLLIEESRVNSLLNSDAPVTQTTGSLVAATYTLWVIGSGTATPSAGTATGCTGFAAASAGTPDVFVCTGAGTIVVTKGGSLTRFQLENGAFPTSYIPTTGATATRAGEVASMPIGSWFNASTSTIVVEALKLTASNSKSETIAGFIGAGIKTSINVQASNNVAMFDSAGPLNASLGAEPTGAVFGVAYAFTNGSQRASLNGAAVVSATAATLSSPLTTLVIGSDGNAQFYNGYIRRVPYWPRVLPPASLQLVAR